MNELLEKWSLNPTEALWIVVGLIGQAAFFGRFILQWLASERAKKSVIPVAFWYLSIFGSLMLLSYSIYRRDPIFILGFSLNCLIYFRNLTLIKRESST